MPHPQHQPPTSNYHNISNPYLNNLFFSVYLSYSPMAQYTKYEVNRALADITSSQSTRDVSSKWGVPRSTLRSRLKGQQPFLSFRGSLLVRRLSWPARCKSRLTSGLRQRTSK
ncbi:transposase [Colletotrichum incanum]|uniref:Transposase n=1 Tax=Colletotrichum incanum TaxID=1573173 RepID=A0A167AVS5_COLIC|nr:transposase [Colletotrichum incanum]OHX00020.1 transposase [Colletotrichum incanum]